MSSEPRVLADDIYPESTSAFRQLSDVVGVWPSIARRGVSRLGPVRALALLSVGRRYDVIVTFRQGSGWRSLVLLRALLGRRRKLVVLHFIVHPPRRGGVGALVDRLWEPIERWALRRTLLRAQVLSGSERDLYAAALGIDRERFVFIPFAWRMSDRPAPTPSSVRQTVVSAGRAMCDWPTLFAAARGRSWPLIVVCGAHDRMLVEHLNRDGRASVLCDLPPTRTSELLLQAAVCALALEDWPASHGQIRLCNAVDAGAAVVASDVRALRGYVEDGRTALMVPPGDPEALGGAIDRLMSDLELRDRLAMAGFERARAWTAGNYVAAVEAFVRRGASPVLPPSG